MQQPQKAINAKQQSQQPWKAINIKQTNMLQQPKVRFRKLDTTTEASRITEKKMFDIKFDPIAEFPDVFPTSKPIALLLLHHINHKIKIIDEEVHWRMKPRHFKPREAFIQQLQEKIAAELKTGRI